MTSFDLPEGTVIATARTQALSTTVTVQFFANQAGYFGDVDISIPWQGDPPQLGQKVKLTVETIDEGRTT